MRPIGASAAKRLGYRLLPLIRLLLGLGAAALFVGFGVEWVTRSGCEPQLDLQFTGSSDCAKGEAAFHASLWRDTVFALAYGVAPTVAALTIPAQDHLDPRLGALDAA